ncbi:Synaptophysin-like protein 2 [Amphibalanus amphitrite]|uniref:Synaptophysin-like protein 2 n=1 Tax=Amphibalanus amphitrite TaxID=1232801 RepID=A0A6A4UXJ5_AMPAM|nr:synaptophysin-like protein 2 [Amphibalanus amphitrite]XP_043192208.1 synaptophysin-like protein 2 [Amphibalanus amphitrite]XP_043192209.1 synaptophysin-like protein 2 [Amphibalanus amphitrite]XP_043192210.1 synaptophysin-like protein 2 [Amphibalanus amphitrite]XP_043192211.1 synaptophysin-like protein 2 [Amphibalanus amphitrite]XP_043192212.1 synaptophysin-like protein 2 [Amphibalanus amphitrite]XP_043192213.1 synaptophysin-like protein 2 [Amphibalanus amphitrite]XP_043192214.1 synaptophy
MVQLNLDAVKEPKGFMKVLQFFFAILAFATTTSFSTYFTFHASIKPPCNDTGATVVRQEVSYPFRLDTVIQEKQLCTQPAVEGRFHFQTDTSSDAEFFVAIGVICMLYSMAALAGYTLYGERYSESDSLPTADFLLHGLLAFLWLCAASAWAAGAGTLKDGCNPEVWMDQVCKGNVTCTFESGDFKGSFGKLNISLLFGFLNTFLWASNMWFLYKETPWFRGNQQAAPPAGDVGNI